MSAALLPLTFLSHGMTYDEIAFEPTRGVFDDRLQRARFRKEMGGARNNLDRFWSLQHRERLFVQFDYAEINAADDQQSWRAYVLQHLAGKIGTPAARHDRPNAVAEPGGCDQRRRRAGAGAEKSEPKA